MAVLMLAVPAQAEDTLPAPEAAALLASNSIVLVDVRTPAEWAETGIPVGAQTASWGQPDFAERVLKIARGDKHAPVVLICRTGNRSGRALAFLRDRGFTQVRHVAEGMAGSVAGPGWLARTLPTVGWQAN